jgi:uncharacterized protein (DUF2147 family)
MHMKKTLGQCAVFAIGLSLLLSAHAQQAVAGASENGRWLTESGNVEVQIMPCGEALCGKVVKVLANRSMSSPGAAMAAADDRSPLGMQILTGFTPAGDGEWKGNIYNRENGETYDCLMSLASPDQLKVRGYKGIALFGKTQIWTRVAGEPAQ